MVAGVYEQWTQGRWDTVSMTVSSYSGTAVIEETQTSRARRGGVWSNDSTIWFVRSDDAGNVYLSEQKVWTGAHLP